MEIRTFVPEMTGDYVAIYNRLTVRTPYCYPITPEILGEAVTLRSELDPSGLLLAYVEGKPVGLIHTWTFERDGKKGGSIVMFLCDHRDACRGLLRAAVAHLKQRAVRVCYVMGNARGAQLFYAGMYMGYEVSVWRGHYETMNAFERAGFELVADGFVMSLRLETEPALESAAVDVSLRVVPGTDAGSFYTRGSVDAWMSEGRIGACGYYFLKRLSKHLGKGVGQITIWVDERYHRQHIGSAMLTRAHRELYRLGARTVILATNYALYPALRMYEKLGYHKELIDCRTYVGYLDEME